MKPLKLTIEGINSFVEPRTVDFERLAANNMFCICGPTGSGKTTVLDCIILALYAPASHHRGSLRDYINTTVDRGKVELLFEADGKRYTVRRELRKTKDSINHKASLVCEDTGEVLADKADTVTERIKQMLKLGKDDFTKVVVLEQGRFAEFMQMRKGERCSTVAKLFDLERLENLKDTVLKAKSKYDNLLKGNEASLRQYEGDTEEALRECEKRVKALAKEIAECKREREKAEKELSADEIAKAAHARRISAGKTKEDSEKELAVVSEQKLALEKELEAEREESARLSELNKASDKAHALLSLVKACEDDLSERDAKVAERNGLRAKYAESQSKHKQISGEISSLDVEKERNSAVVASIMRDIAECGYTLAEQTEAGFAALCAQAGMEADRLAEAEKKIAELKVKKSENESLQARLIEGENEQKRLAEAAETKAKECAAEYENARIMHEAAAVRSALHDGDTCPVCGGVYHGSMAERDGDDETLARLKSAAEKAEAERKKHVEDLRKYEDEQKRNIDKADALKKDIESYEKLLGDKNSATAYKCSEAAGKGSSAARIIADCDNKRTAFTAALSAEEDNMSRIKAEGSKLGEQIDKIEKKVEERLGGRRPDKAKEEAEGAIKNYEEAREAAEKKRELLSARASELSSREAAAKAKLSEAVKTLEELPKDGFDSEKYELRRAHVAALKERAELLSVESGSVSQTAEGLGKRLKLKKAYADERKSLMKKADNLADLHSCVRDNKFFMYVAENYVQAFTAAASDTLFSLTNGKYTLIYDGGEFYVADYFADNTRRKVKTLSGGETFLASMSIAMAISRQIASQNYEFFFLDEGFGTLHERAMETVRAALEKLSRDTIVGIVTHRSELADGIAARLTVIPATEDSGSDLRYDGD